MAKALVVSTKFTAIDKFSQTMRKMTASTNRFATKTQASMSRVSRSMRSINRGLKSMLKPMDRAAKWAFAGVVAGAGLAVRKFVNEASKIENSVAGFTPLLGSVEKAEKLVDMLNKTAATTPFQFENISSTANQLLPLMNGDLNKTIDTFRMLGDTAGGNAQKLESITRGYTKVLGKGKADMESLNMITEAGVPIMDQLSKMYGVSIEKLYQMSSQGKISANDITKVFRKMTSEGGIFFKGMEIASQTWSGLLSTLKDNINLTFAAIGKQALPILKEYQTKLIEAVSKMRDWVNNNQDLIKQKIEIYIKKIVSAITFLIQNWDKIIRVIKIVIITYASLKAATVAINAVMAITNVIAAANPFVLIALAVIALIGGIVALVKNWESLVNWIKTSDNWFAKLIRVALKPIIWVIDGISAAWKRVKEAFKSGGIWGVIKSIGKSIFSFILAPLEGILKLTNKLTKGKIGGETLAKIQAFRADLTSSPEQQPALNPDATIEQVRTERIEKTKNEKVSIELSAAKGTEATIKEDTGNMVQLTPTLGWQ